ncbi:helix-turn-helix transcriptional regulator [Paenibacillus provencensis]|uniref:Helix-turn-helix transcriptional regulator n=1 Tax=Paenibacillus provencensis TaxID=441151 RepID=A0ABW3Q1U3_9BACL
MSITPHHLHRTFKTVTGSTPLQFLHHTRIEEGKKLLSTSSRSVTHISFRLGYTSLSHFSKVFKAKTQITPSDFRKDSNKIYFSATTED